MGFITYPLLFGTALATIDVIVLSLLKAKYLGTIQGLWVFVFAFIVYGCQVFIFYASLHYGSLTQMNLMWDLTSDVLVTFIGLYFFKEAMTPQQRAGVIFGFMAIMLLK